MHKAATRRNSAQSIAAVAHHGQSWKAPKRGTTWKGTKNCPNTRFEQHYSDTNKEPGFVIQARKARAKAKITEVYFIRFTPKGHPEQRFLKIGITRQGVEARFSADLERFDFELLHRIPCLTPSQAYALEQGLHSIFSGSSHRPEYVLLSGGNTECFRDTVELEREVCKLMSSIA